jgi:hypothetical protein
MLTKTKIALSVAVVLGAASAALANEPTGADGGGYRVQSWQATQAQGAYNAYGLASPKKNLGFVASPKQGRRLSREND